MLINLLFLSFGLVLLVVGADWLVKGAASLARRLGVKPIVIGLTVIAFGTSAPELVVNLLSAWNGSPDLALGNIFGSNLANLLLILGLTAVMATIKIPEGTVWREIPFLLLASAAVLLLGCNHWLGAAGENILSRPDGLLMLALFGVFLYYTYTISRQKGSGDDEIAVYSHLRSLGYILLGLVGLTAGGKLIVDSAVFIARELGASEHLIGATVIAIGTSLPELAASIVAAWRRQPELAVGNIVGSNIFNILFVLAMTAVLVPIPFGEAALIDGAFALLATLVLFFALFVGRRHHFERWQGVAFLFLYAAYITFSLLRG